MFCKNKLLYGVLAYSLYFIQMICSKTLNCSEFQTKRLIMYKFEYHSWTIGSSHLQWIINIFMRIELMSLNIPWNSFVFICKWIFILENNFQSILTSKSLKYFLMNLTSIYYIIIHLFFKQCFYQLTLQLR